jgi:DNA-binding NarL/FixJ family response regulator
MRNKRSTVTAPGRRGGLRAARAGAPGVLRASILAWDGASSRHLHRLCSAAGVIEVVGLDDDAEDARRRLEEGGVDVVLLDLDGAPHDPVWLVRLLRAGQRDTRIVVWADDVTWFDEVFGVGVDAWVPRRADAGTLAAAAAGWVA